MSAPAHILVVDDEEEVALVLARALSDVGHEVQLAANGQAALDRLAESDYNLLLTDIYMPSLRGDELMVRALERDPQLAVLLITAIDDTSCAVECLKRGAFDFLLKPFDLDDVLIRVEKALSRQRLERENEEYRVYLEERIAETTDQLRQTVQQALESLIHTLEAKDPFTQNHSLRVAELASALVARMRPGETHLHAQVRVAALFHDIGKIGIPEHLMHKPGALTEDERSIIQRHAEMGAIILAPMLDAGIVRIVRSHHENWDGTGYPDKLVGEDIPLGARLLAVADAYDAMTSERPHRPALPLPQVIATLQAGAGYQWDPEAVYAFLKLVSTGRLEGRGQGIASAAEEAELAATMVEAGRVKPTERPAPVQSLRDEPIRGARPTLTIDGRFDDTRLRSLRDQLEEVIRRESGSQIVLEMARSSDASDDALHAIYSLDLMARRHGHSLVLRDASPTLRARLSAVQLDGTLLFEESLRLAA